jgi:hypothetical protein
MYLSRMHWLIPWYNIALSARDPVVEKGTQSSGAPTLILLDFNIELNNMPSKISIVQCASRKGHGDKLWQARSCMHQVICELCCLFHEKFYETVCDAVLILFTPCRKKRVLACSFVLPAFCCRSPDLRVSTVSLFYANHVFNLQTAPIAS